MAIPRVNAAPLFLLFLFSLFPFIHSLSTVAISETGNQTVVCAVTQARPALLNCTIYPQGIQVTVNSWLSSISGIVAGNGFLCALTSFHSTSPSSVMVCWRFSNFTSNMPFKRIYRGNLVKELDAGNSNICGLVDSGSNSSLQCWPTKDFNQTAHNLSSSLTVGDNFVCGLSGSGQINCFGISNNVKGQFSQVEAGSQHACAVSVHGNLKCWGNGFGETPTGEFTSIALGQNRSCAIRKNDTVVCWGDDNGFSLPVSLMNQSFLTLEAKGRVFCGVVMGNYSLFCWGTDNFNGTPLVFKKVVPGPCRTECACNTLPDYSAYCPPDLKICKSCAPPEPPPVSPPEPPPVPPPQPLPPQSRKKWDGKMVAFMVVGCVGCFSLLVTLCAFIFPRYIKIRSTRIHDSGRLEEGDMGTSPQGGGTPQSQSIPRQPLEKKLSHLISLGNGSHLEVFPLEVLLEATGNFSEDHKIGTGSFGSVYHATLEGTREVAIKRAENTASSSYAGATKRGMEDKDSAFVNELEFLSRLHHKNLVRLLGYCEDGNERVLVYEYMDNGTLFDHLHKLESSPLMSWVMRIQVALDAARGIEYLHEYAVPHIIHRDIKSSNILIDNTWTAKVSDFGLSLMGPQEEDAQLSLGAAGTMGYMDPEYYRTHLLTSKSDVYSFGIVLLELLSGCKAIHRNENGVPRNVVDYVIPYIVQDEIHRVLDKRVPPPTPFEIEGVAYMGYLAADCVMLQGKDRPTMREVVNSLDKALDACLAPQMLSRSTSSSSIDIAS